MAMNLNGIINKLVGGLVREGAKALGGARKKPAASHKKAHTATPASGVQKSARDAAKRARKAAKVTR
ncbi:MAG: hypothetical protein QM656_17270, partial [Paracoccaceae bacterium]